jgi:hypothetical protein
VPPHHGLHGLGRGGAVGQVDLDAVQPGWSISVRRRASETTS